MVGGRCGSGVGHLSQIMLSCRASAANTLARTSAGAHHTAGKSVRAVGSNSSRLPGQIEWPGPQKYVQTCLVSTRGHDRRQDCFEQQHGERGTELGVKHSTTMMLSLPTHSEPAPSVHSPSYHQPVFCAPQPTTRTHQVTPREPRSTYAQTAHLRAVHKHHQLVHRCSRANSRVNTGSPSTLKIRRHWL